MKKLLLSLVFSSGIACAPADRIDVKILTPLGMEKKFHNLKNDFLAGPINLDLFTATHCYQPELYAGSNDQVESNLLKLKPLKLRSERAGTGTYSLNSWIKDHSILDEAITVSVLKGQPVDVAVMGAFYEPSSGSSDHLCEEVYSSVALPTLSVVGHRVVNTTAPTTITLNTWGMDYDANPAIITPPPGTDPSSGAFFSCTDYPANQNCAGHDLVKITIGDPSSLKVKKLEYFHNSDQSLKITQSFEGMVGVATIWAPHYFPMIVTYIQSNSSVGTQTITDPTQAIYDPTYNTYPNRKIQFTSY